MSKLPASTQLDDVLMTEELLCRSPRQPNLQAENQALRSLAWQLAHAPDQMLQRLVELARELCGADTAGVSLIEMQANGEEVFRWGALAGALADQVGGCVSRHFSPCGVCLEQKTPVMFAYPERYFTDLQQANLPMPEMLVLPLVVADHALGTLWLVNHHEQRQFDPEDVRLMAGLADFTAATLLRSQQQAKELLMAGTALQQESAERKLAEERALALVENLPGGAAFMVDRDLRYVMAAGEALATADCQPEDFVGRTIFEVLPPELAASYEPMYRMALAGESFEHEHYAHDRWYITRGTPLPDDDGNIYAVLAVSYDVTDRKQVEAAIAADLQDTQRLRDLSVQLIAEGDIQTLYQEILAVAITLVEADAGTVQILDETTQELVMLANQDIEPTLIEHFSRIDAGSNTSCGRALATGARAFVDFDVPESEGLDGSSRMHVEAGYYSAQSTLLMTRSGQPIGMLSTHWRKPHRPSERELRFLDLLVRQAADLIEQRQAEVALRESEAKYRSLFNSIDEGYFLCDVIFDENDQPIDLFYIDENPAAVHMMGQSFRGQRLRAINPNYEEYWYEIFGRVAQTGHAERLERYAKPDQIWYDFYIFKVGGDDTHQVAVVFSDVTDRKRSEAQLSRAAETDAFRVKLSDALRSLADPVAIQGEATRLLREYFDAGWCYYVEWDETGTIGYVLRDNTRDGLPSMVGVHDVSDTPEFTDFLHSGRLLNVSNFATFPLFTPRVVDRYTAIGIHSVLGVPLVKEGRLMAVLSLADTAPREWSSEAITLISEVVDRTWETIERAKAEAALRESEARLAADLAGMRRLYDLYTTLSTGLDLKTALDEILAIACEFTHTERGCIQLISDDGTRLEMYNWRGYDDDSPFINHFRHEGFKEGCDQVRVARERFIIEETIGFPGLEGTEAGAATYAEGIWAAQSTPIINRSNETIGVLSTQFSHPHRPSDDELRLVDLLAWTAADFVERYKAYEALRASEAKYRSLFDTIDEGFTIAEVIYDSSGQPVDILYLEANPAASRLMGVPDFTQRRLSTISSDWESYWVEFYDRVARTGVSERTERYAAPLQRWYDFSVFRLAATAASGNPRVAVIFQDITERKQREQQQAFLLKFSDALRTESDADAVASRAVRMIAEHLRLDRCWLSEVFEQQGISTVGPEYHRSDLSPMSGVFRLSDYPETMRQLETQPMVIPDATNDPRFADAEKALLDQLHLRSLLVTPLRKGQHQVIWAIAATMTTPRHWSESERMLLEQVGERIWAAVERARAEAALQQMMQNVQALNTTLEQRVQQRTAQLEAINQELDAFSSMVSHDLQTPLRHISSFVERLQAKLQAEPTDPSNRRYLSIIEQAAAQAQRMINDMLEFSRMGKTPLHLIPVSMNQLMRQMRSQLASEIGDRDIQWQIGPLPEVQGDPQMLRLVIQNLLSNAVKYTRNCDPASITIGSETYAHEIVFFVQDNGAGFDMQYQDRLFSLFQRLHSQEQFAGTGVGLANVRRIIHRHGGRVWAKGAVAQGATFYFSLPTAGVPI